MPTKKQIQPGEKLPLRLTAAERKLILDELIVTGMEYEHTIRDTPAGQAVMMSLDDLDDLGGYIAETAHQCQDTKKEKRLDAILVKIEDLVFSYTDEEPPQTVRIEDARKAKLMSDQAVQIADWAAKALAAAEQLGIKRRPLERFWLAPAQRDVLLLVPGVTKAIKSKLATEKSVTVGEVVNMVIALVKNLPDGDARKQMGVLLVAKHLMEQLHDQIVGSANAQMKKGSRGKAEVASGTLFQFKVTLLGIEPAIWRRIQVQDCTLDELHEHIQTAMGWTNSHLHQFEIKGQRYGDPELLDDGFEDFECMDSTRTLLSKIP